MPANDDVTPDHPLPLFLSGHADEQEQRGSSQSLKAIVVIATATVIGGAITLSLGNPGRVFTEVWASLTEISDLGLGTDQRPQAIQPPAETPASPPIAGGLPARDELATTSDPPDRSQNETAEAPSGALLKQFEAWAAEQDVRPQVEPERPAQDARAQALQNAHPSAPHRRVRASQTGRTDNRPVRNPHARVPPDQHARAQIRPAQDARTQDQSVQNAQAPSLLQSLGWGRQ